MLDALCILVAILCLLVGWCVCEIYLLRKIITSAQVQLIVSRGGQPINKPAVLEKLRAGMAKTTPGSSQHRLYVQRLKDLELGN